MVPEQLQPSTASLHKDVTAPNWEIFVEKAGIWGEADFTRMDHINTTKDITDYLWHTTRFFCTFSFYFETTLTNKVKMEG